MARKNIKPLFTWRSAICESNLPATARHVALTMALYMNERGGSAFPGGTRLARETGLALRSVKRALALLEDTGWLTVKYRGGSPVGGVRKATEYAAAFPVTGVTDAPVQDADRCHRVTGDTGLPVTLTTLTGVTDAPQVFSKSPKTSAIESDFNEAWSHYPKKDDRKAALRAYSARRKAGADAADLLAAVQHFAETKAGTEPKFIKHGSTFFGRDEPWRDYVQPPPTSMEEQWQLPQY